MQGDERAVRGDERAHVQAGKDSFLGDSAVLDLTAGVACRGIIRAMIGMDGRWSNSGAMATTVPLGGNQFKCTYLWHFIGRVSTSSYVGGVDN